MGWVHLPLHPQAPAATAVARKAVKVARKGAMAVARETAEAPCLLPLPLQRVHVSLAHPFLLRQGL